MDHESQRSAARISDTTGVGLAYSRRGTGPPVVLIHGWCLSRAMWMYQEVHLADSSCVVMPDLRGFGESRGLAGPYTIEQHADDVAAMLKELDLSGAVLVGFAFGAAVAMALAARNEPRVLGIVAIGVPSAAHAAYERMPRAMRRDWPEFADRSALAICKRELSDASRRWLATMFAATPLPVALETVGVLAESSLRLSPIACRSLRCSCTEPMTRSFRSPFRERAPVAVHGELRVVDDCGHLVPIDQADVLGELLVEHLGRLQG